MILTLQEAEENRKERSIIAVARTKLKHSARKIQKNVRIESIYPLTHLCICSPHQNARILQWPNNFSYARKIFRCSHPCSFINISENICQGLGNSHDRLWMLNFQRRLFLQNFHGKHLLHKHKFQPRISPYSTHTKAFHYSYENVSFSNKDYKNELYYISRIQHPC